MTSNAIVALSIFIITFIFILAEKAIHVHRTIVALLGACVMVIVGTMLNFYTIKSAFLMIDMDTITLLLGMMILVAILEKTGAFQFLAIKSAKLSKGNPIRLLFYLSLITSILSMFLDNVTTIVLIAPVTLIITSMMKISSIPFLITEAILSNISGTSTLVGDPPNIMIASAVPKMSFMSFITHSLPHIVIVWIVVFLTILFIFRKELAEKPSGFEVMLKTKPEDYLTDKPNAVKLCILFCVVVIFFFISEQIHLTTSVIAIFGAGVGFLITKADIEETLKKVEFPILLFFAALFALVGGLEHSGFLKEISISVLSLAKTNMLLCCIVVIWVSAAISAVIDNIPFTIAMIPILQALGLQLGDPNLITPLWWALVFGVGLGGNGTHIGATANIVVVSLSEKTDTPITTLTWLRTGLVTTIISLITVSLTFVVMYSHMTTK